MSITAQTIDQARLDEFMGRFVGDLGAAISAALVVIGDRLGPYRALGDGEPATADELASRTGTDARYVREWLSDQAADGYVTDHPGSERFFLTPEHSFALGQEDSPAFVPGALKLATSLIKDEQKITGAFQRRADRTRRLGPRPGGDRAAGRTRPTRRGRSRALDRPRAGGPHADRRGSVEQGDRRAAVRDRAHGREALQEHPRHARPAPVARRPPARARGAHLPELALRAARTPHAHRLAVPAKTPAVRLGKPAGACDLWRHGRADAPGSTGRRPQPLSPSSSPSKTLEF